MQSKKFTVHYTDGTSVQYSASGAWESLVSVDCPGVLTFSRFVANNGICYYYYFYTEETETTEEFYFYYHDVG